LLFSACFRRLPELSLTTENLDISRLLHVKVISRNCRSVLPVGFRGFRGASGAVGRNDLMARLTKRVVDGAAAPKAGDVFLWDDDLRGFGLRVYASGRRIFVVQYRLRGGRGGRTRRIVLGEYGKLTPDEARKRAAKVLAAVDDGRDPAAERDEAKSPLTIAALATLYLAEGPAAKPNKRASSWATDRSNIERHVKPLLGRKSAKSLTQADVAKFQADVAAGRSKADIKTRKRGRAIVEGGRGTAARSLAVLGAMLQFAVDRRLLPSNPAKGVRLLKGQPKERFLSEAEVARLGDTIATMQAEHRLSDNAANAVRLLLLTGCRKSEITALRWDWVDFERGCLRLPTSKTGAKVVALAAVTLELLAGLRERDPAGAWVCPRRAAMGPTRGCKRIGSAFESVPACRASACTTSGTRSPASRSRTGTRCSLSARRLAIGRPARPRFTPTSGMIRFATLQTARRPGSNRR